MRSTLRDFLGHMLLGATFLVLTLVPGMAFSVVKESPVPFFSLPTMSGFLAFFTAATFIRGKIARSFFLNFFLILNFVQMVHVSFFGTQILPIEFWLFFAELGEVSGTLLREPAHLFVPLILTATAVVVGVFAEKRLKPRTSIPYLGALLALYLLYNPARTFLTGNSWGRQPSAELPGGLNAYLSLSYFTGKILPHKLQSLRVEEKNTSTDLVVTGRSASDWDKIIVILGESHSPHLMSLFGYPKPTTPYLESLKDSDDFYSGIGLSAGVSTDVSIAFFMNLGFGRAGGRKAALGKHCLLKLARENGFRTHFWSTQSRQQLRYIAPFICHSSLDSFRSLEDVDPGIEDENTASDLKLLSGLEKVFSEEGKSFLVLHQRGSHSPWEARYPQNAARFFPVDGDDRTHHYENSIHEFDRFWKELDGFLGRRKERVLVVYVSDHGEAVGTKGRWGHGFLEKEAFEIPVIARSYRKSLLTYLHNRPGLLTQYNVGLMIASELGYDLNQDPGKLPLDYEVFGNDIDGFAGHAKVKFEDEKNYSFIVK